MSHKLSAQSEQFLDSIVAGGAFSSKGAALEAAVAALREKTGDIPLVPSEHMELVEQGLSSLNDGKSREWTSEDWAILHQYVSDIAEKKSRNGQ